MWFYLKRIVFVGTNQVKGFSNLSCCATGSRILHPRLLSTKPAEQLNNKVRLNSETQGAPYLLTEEQEEYIAQGSPEALDKLRGLAFEFYVNREKGHLFPETISLDNLKIMLGLSRTGRKAYLHYLNEIEQKKKERKLAKQMLKQMTEKPLPSAMYPWLDYKVFANCLFPRIPKQDLSLVYNSNAINGLQYGQKIIIDCSYDDDMDEIRTKKAALQILKCYYSSRTNRRPFAMHVCNLDFTSKLMFYLQKNHPGFETNASIGIHSESYLDLFDRKKLVYLSPHSNVKLKYNPEDIYIIGGFVDLHTASYKLSYSHKKAIQESIRHACLPLDDFLKWKRGSKSLCINHCFDILLDVKNNRNWLQALQKNVPSRKL